MTYFNWRRMFEWLVTDTGPEVWAFRVLFIAGLAAIASFGAGFVHFVLETTAIIQACASRGDSAMTTVQNLCLGAPGGQIAAVVGSGILFIVFWRDSHPLLIRVALYIFVACVLFCILGNMLASATSFPENPYASSFVETLSSVMSGATHQSWSWVVAKQDVLLSGLVSVIAGSIITGLAMRRPHHQ